MERNVKTDMENLNKLYEINRIYNSPEVVGNYYPSAENTINNTVYLGKLSPYNYIPPYVKVVKKYNYNSLSPHKKTKSRYYDNFYSINRDNKRDRTYNYSTDFYTHGKYKMRNKNINNINRINFETPEQIPKRLKNRNFIYISPSYIPKKKKRNINYYFQPINNEDFNKSMPIYLVNQSVEDKYLTTLNDNNISFSTNNNNINMNKTFPYYSASYTPNNNNIFINSNFNNDIKIKLDDLIYLERRFNDIIIALNSIRIIYNINALDECIEFFSFYFNSSFKNKFVYFFAEQNNIIVQTAFNLILYMIIISYHLSLHPSMLIKVIGIIKNIFEKLRVNLFLFIRKIELYYGEIFCAKNEIYFNNYNSFLIKNGIYDLSEIDIIDIVSRNSVQVSNEINNILDFYYSFNNKYFYDFQNIFLLLSKTTEDDLNNYFLNNILNINISDDNINNNVIYYNNYDNYIIQNEEDENEQYLNNAIFYYKMNKEIPPFLKFKSTKKYTLVLDLGGTLINVKIDSRGKAICRLRPGLYDFLIGVKPLYEIISYTKLSKEYSDLIIQQIEKNQPLFDYNLYREHCVLVGNNFVKDISLLGRDMTKIIMIDDVPENLEKHIENGILILPFDGENSGEDDRVLFELKKLLTVFYNLGYEDLRNAIKSYKNEIFDKITLGNIN
jgi:hypothetical protein